MSVAQRTHTLGVVTATLVAPPAASRMTPRLAHSAQVNSVFGSTWKNAPRAILARNGGWFTELQPGEAGNERALGYQAELAAPLQGRLSNLCPPRIFSAAHESTPAAPFSAVYRIEEAEAPSNTPRHLGLVVLHERNQCLSGVIDVETSKPEWRVALPLAGCPLMPDGDDDTRVAYDAEV